MNTFTIIIPTYNDDKYLPSKLSNLMDMTYDAMKVQIIIARGGSSKNALHVISKVPFIQMLYTTTTGKINQLNEALAHCYGDYILITDADSTLDKTTLIKIDKAMSSSKVYCCGTITKVKGHIIDKAYWFVANHIRRIEARIYSSSHVTAPGYAFKKDLIKAFPKDVVADDVYIALTCAAQGYRTVITRAISTELRSPVTLRSFYKHKMRKGNAVLKELLRFMYRINDMPHKFKIIYLLRLFQFTVLTPTILLTYSFTRQTSNYDKIPSNS